MKQNNFPIGWDLERINKVLSHYESQSEEEAVTEDETTFGKLGQTVMEIPTDLVPAVRELLVNRKAA